MADQVPPIAAEAPRFGRAQLLGGLITLVVLAVIFIGVLPQFANYSEAWDAITRISVAGLVALGLAIVVSVLVYVLPYQAALPHLAYGPAFVVRQTSFMISNTVPAGGAIGLAIQFSMLSSYGVGAAQATAGIGITSVWNIAVTLVLPWLAIVGLLVIGEMTAGAPVVAALVGLVVIVGGVVIFTLILRSEAAARRIGEWTDRAINGVMHLFGREPEVRLTDVIIDFRTSTVGIIRERWIWVTGSNVLQQLAQFAVLAVALRGIQQGSTDQVTVIEAFAAFSFARLLSFIPITPGGLGTVDAAMIAFLTAFGASTADATAAVLVWRACSYFPQVFIGIATFLYWRRRTARARRAQSSGPGTAPTS